MDRDPLKDLSKESDKGQSRFDLVLASFQRLLRRGAITNISKMLGKMHPADTAKLIEHLSSQNEKRTIFELVRGETLRGKVLSEMDPNDVSQVLTDIAPADVAMLLRDLGKDDVAYLLGVLPEEQAKEILKLMRTEDSSEIAEILKYPKDTAGGIMTTEFLSLPEETTAQ
jgi:magnesium transporter